LFFVHLLSEPRYLITVFCYGCNLGPTQTARSIKGLDRRQMSFVNQRHITEEKLNQTITTVINAYAQFPLQRIWGSGKSASADGTIGPNKHHRTENNRIAFSYSPESLLGLVTMGQHLLHSWLSELSRKICRALPQLPLCNPKMANRPQPPRPLMLFPGPGIWEVCEQLCAGRATMIRMDSNQITSVRFIPEEAEL
jgi:Tn3 transposase DDE domain